MRLLWLVLLATVLAGSGFVALAATDNIPFVGEASEGEDVEQGPVVQRRGVDRFDERAAFRFLRRQVVDIGPRPAGSAASLRLARILRRDLPRGRFQRVPGGLRNVIGRVPGRDRGRYVVVGGHYDTKDIPNFVGANDGASGTAVIRELARTLEPRQIEPTVVFILFDGEEAPPGTEDQDFADVGLRGSKIAARAFADAEAMINVDFVGEKRLRIPREGNSDPRLWSKLRAAARRVGYGAVFPAGTQGAILDDHIPFKDAGIPAIDLIDFDFACFHRPCDDMSVVSRRSVDAAGETLVELLDSYR